MLKPKSPNYAANKQPVHTRAWQETQWQTQDGGFKRSLSLSLSPLSLSHLDCAIDGQHDVLQLDVAMDHIHPMQCRDSLQERSHDRDERTVLVEPPDRPIESRQQVAPAAVFEDEHSDVTCKAMYRCYERVSTHHHTSSLTRFHHGAYSPFPPTPIPRPPPQPPSPRAPPLSRPLLSSTKQPTPPLTFVETREVPDHVRMVREARVQLHLCIHDLWVHLAQVVAFQHHRLTRCLTHASVYPRLRPQACVVSRGMGERQTSIVSSETSDARTFASCCCSGR